MGEKRRRQEIVEKNYDEFLGHPDFIEDARRDPGEDQYPLLSGNEGMHDVVKHVAILQARAEAPEARPAADKKASPSKTARRDDLRAVYQEQLIHPDFTIDTRPGAVDGSAVIHGNEAMQDCAETGWH